MNPNHFKAECERLAEILKMKPIPGLGYFRKGFLAPYFKICKHVSDDQFTKIVDRLIEEWDKATFPLPATFKNLTPEKKKYFDGNYPEPEDVLTGDDFSKAFKEMRKEFNI